MAKLVVFHKEKEFCEGVHVLLGPAILGDLLNVDVFCMEELKESSWSACTLHEALTAAIERMVRMSLAVVIPRVSVIYYISDQANSNPTPML